MKKLQLGRCVALDQHGGRCRKAATMHERYHGNEEFYGYLTERKGVQWIVAAFCDEHGPALPKPKKAKASK